jgi:hypothetical protein
VVFVPGFELSGSVELWNGCELSGRAGLKKEKAALQRRMSELDSQCSAVAVTNTHLHHILSSHHIISHESALIAL